MTITEKKNKEIDMILQNPVYMPDSGLYLSLHAYLMRLPLGTIENLCVLISIKVRDAEQKRLDELLK